MSKSPSDASRFTQTTPSVSRPSNLRTSRPLPTDRTPRPATTSAGAGIETPAQKVARLRAAHLAKRASQISTWDKVVVRGREIADTAHRWTVLTIVVASVAMIGVTGFTIADMVRYNRAKKATFYAEQSELLKKRFVEALEAEGRGTATEDQLELLREERANAEAAEVKKQKPGVWKSTKDYIKGALDLNLSKEDRKYGERRQAILERIDEHEKKVAAGQASETISPTLNVIHEKRREVENQLLQAGRAGPLDQIAEEVTQKVEKTKKGWSSWFS